MKIEIYEPHKVGYVSVDPYDWNYEGKDPRVVQFLDGKPTLYEGVALEGADGETAEGRRELTGEEYLRQLGRDLTDMMPWETIFIQDG